MSSSDPVPDVAPEVQPAEKPQPSVSSPNSYFIYLIIILGWLVFHRLGWEAVLLLLGERLPPDALKYFWYIWLIPIAGVLGSIVVPSLGTTTLWLIGSSITSSIPLAIAAGYVLLFGNRRDLPVSA